MNMLDDASFLPVSSNSSLPGKCSITSILRFIAFSVVHVLVVVPIFAVVLGLGYRRWRRQLHVSHSDVFTYHSFVMEMFMVAGGLFYTVGAYTHHSEMMECGLNVFFSIWSTKIHFHSLTCLEQYLAVVHPVSYLHMRNSSGVRIRNCSIVCVWLFFVCALSAAVASSTADAIIYYSFLAFGLFVDSFCCTSVLCVLRRPGPGTTARSRERIDPKKRRAFYTIVAIMGVVLLCLGGVLIGGALIDWLKINESECLGETPEVWFSLPSSLVLPLLYLHRAGKLTRRKHRPESD